MKKTWSFAFVCLLAAAARASAQEAGSAGVGVVLGAPTAVTGKLWLDHTQALDLGLGWNDRLTVYGDYLWHGWKVLPQPTQGRLPVYLGLGAQDQAYRDSQVGIRAVAGVAYWLPKNPVEIFAEAVPVFYLSRDTGVGLGGGIGIRYYFKSGSSS